MNKKRDVAKANTESVESAGTYWRSPQHKEGKPEFSDELDYEYTPTAEELKSLSLNRRNFVGLMGASMAMAGVGTGCIRKGVQHILPYNQRPEDIIPGKPIYFATAMNIGFRVQPLLIESQEGRPTKVEGNPSHPMSLGATDGFAQASVMDLYDPDRTKKPSHAGRETSWEELFKAVDVRLKDAHDHQGDGLALIVENTPSPSFHAALAELKKKHPKSRVFLHDPAHRENVLKGYEMLGMSNHHPLFKFDKASRVVSVGSDFLGLEGDHVLHNKDFSKGRDLSAFEDYNKIAQADLSDKMNRLYVAEAAFSVTGAAADHRLRVRVSDQEEFLASLATALIKAGLKAPAGAEAFADQLGKRFDTFKTAQNSRYIDWESWLEVVAADLKAHTGESLVMVGEHLSPRAHALGLFINQMLGSVGKDKPLRLLPSGDHAQVEPITNFADAVRGGGIKSLFILGGDPVYTMPADSNISKLIDTVPFALHLGTHMNATARLATWHVPMNHYLESWGDLRTTDGTVTIQQPLIAPLYGTLSALEMLGYILDAKSVKGYELVRAYWKSEVKGKGFEEKWRKWLHEGMIPGTTAAHVDKKADWSKVIPFFSDTPSSSLKLKGYDLIFAKDDSVFDGRFANNAFLQECPDAITKLTWDNAALINIETSKEMKLDNGEWIRINLGKKAMQMPVYIVPGIAKKTIVLPLGYGSTTYGRVSKGAGFDVNVLRSSASPHFAFGASVKKLFKERYLLASTQEHGRKEMSFAGYGSLQEPSILGIKGTNRQSIVRQASLKEFQEDPKRFEKMEVMPKNKLKSLWEEPNSARRRSGQQWGMAVDLSKCNGCSACIIACNTENNISIVGKERVRVGREMHWMRLDRYYHNDPVYGDASDQDDAEVVTQPMFCVHCENAPCENVCPVAATVHSPSGMNDMAYNRCIGTRYCSNNCPYKVRRFNFFNYSKENDSLLPTMQMQRNPDVTVRFRGVMEKCNYCVQRVNAAVIDAKSSGDGYVKDGVITPACQQVCPSDAITFGDVDSKDSQVAKAKKRDRNYAVLAELNNKPRTTYLARIRNRNPKLAFVKKKNKPAADKASKKG